MRVVVVVGGVINWLFVEYWVKFGACLEVLRALSEKFSNVVSFYLKKIAVGVSLGANFVPLGEVTYF